MTARRAVLVVACTLSGLALAVACQPRRKATTGTTGTTPTQVATDTQPTTTHAATGTTTGTGTGSPTTSPIPTPGELPTVLGPAWTPTGLSWPPGLPPIAIPAGFPTIIAPWPSVFPLPTPAPVPTAQPAPPPPPPGGDWPASYAAMEDQVLTLVNERRAAGANCGGKLYGPAKPLGFEAHLRSAARGHSVDMINRGYFDHIAPDGSTPTDRIKATGFSVVGYTGENIAAGNATAPATVQQWMDSPGHCENIMNPHYNQLGVGYSFGASAKYRHYWTQNFAGPQ